MYKLTFAFEVGVKTKNLQRGGVERCSGWSRGNAPSCCVAGLQCQHASLLRHALAVRGAPHSCIPSATPRSQIGATPSRSSSSSGDTPAVDHKSSDNARQEAHPFITQKMEPHVKNSATHQDTLPGSQPVSLGNRRVWTLCWVCGVDTTTVLRPFLQTTSGSPHGDRTQTMRTLDEDPESNSVQGSLSSRYLRDYPAWE